MSNIQKQHKISPAIAWLTIQKFIIFYCPLDGEHTITPERGEIKSLDIRTDTPFCYLFFLLNTSAPDIAVIPIRTRYNTIELLSPVSGTLSFASEAGAFGFGIVFLVCCQFSLYFKTVTFLKL